MSSGDLNSSEMLEEVIVSSGKVGGRCTGKAQGTVEGWSGLVYRLSPILKLFPHNKGVYAKSTSQRRQYEVRRKNRTLIMKGSIPPISTRTENNIV